MKTKICSKCKKELLISEFSKDKYKKDGLHCQCKQCMKNYLDTHKEEGKKCDKIYRNNNKEKIKIYHKKHKKERNLYLKNRRKKDTNFRIRYYLANRIRKVLKGKLKSSTTIKLIGCTIEQFKQHLKSQFTIGMSWKNWGTGKNDRGMYEWHIDHIKPCASFDLSKPEQQRKCFNYTNLQPLWAKENLQKGAK